MRIMQLCKSVYPHSIGGVEVYVHSLTKQLAERGHEVCVIVTRKSLKEHDSRIIPGPNLKAILRILDRERYDCLHIHSFASLGISELAGTLLFNRLKKKKPVIITPHGSLNSILYCYYGLSLRFLLQRAYVFYLRKLSVFVDYFIVFTQQQQEMWRRLGFPTEKVLIVPPFAALEKCRVEEFSDKKENKNILYVGRLSQEKGIDFLLRAIPQVLEEISNVKLHIVGDGETRKNLMDLADKLGIKDHVVFYGNVRHERLAEIYRESDVFVLPSVCAEGFPLVLLEAMEQGLPVVTTNFGGQAEMVRPGFNGELVSPRDSESLAEKIHMLLTRSDLAKSLSANARIFARNFFSGENVERLEEVYNKCVGAQVLR